jgi:hypothetical protein
MVLEHVVMATSKVDVSLFLCTTLSMRVWEEEVKLRQSDEIYTPINFDYLRHPLDRRLGDP